MLFSINGFSRCFSLCDNKNSSVICMRHNAVNFPEVQLAKSCLVFRFIRKTYTWWSPKSSQWKALRFSLKSGGFHWKAAVFTWKPYKSTNSRQILQFHCVLGEAMSQDSMKTAAFHENHCFSHENHTKDHQLPEMVTPMFYESLSGTPTTPTAKSITL